MSSAGINRMTMPIDGPLGNPPMELRPFLEFRQMYVVDAAVCGAATGFPIPRSARKWTKRCASFKYLRESRSDRLFPP